MKKGSAENPTQKAAKAQMMANIGEDVLVEKKEATPKEQKAAKKKADAASKRAKQRRDRTLSKMERDFSSSNQKADPCTESCYC